MYMTGDNITISHMQRLSKLMKASLWPSQKSPIIQNKSIKKIPDNLLLIAKKPSEQRLNELLALPCIGIVDAHALDTSIQTFTQKLQKNKNKKMGVLLTCPVIYASNVAELFTHALGTRLTLTATQLEGIHFALHESIVNGLIHGNLHVNSQMRQSARDFIEYARLLHDRLNDPSYAQKSISIIATWTSKKLEIKIRDEGAGYELNSSPKLTPHVQPKTGRGIKIIAGTADSCTIEDFGREITLSFLLTDAGVYHWAQNYVSDNESASAQMTVPDLTQCSVLIVEDNLSTQTVLGRLLNVIGITNISFASDGIEGLTKATELQPDLIILDITMPRMDGYEVMHRLKQDKKTNSIPVLIQTASDNRETREKTFSAGATDFITKPINPLEFFSRVKVHLENRLLVKNLQNQLNQIETELQSAQRMQMDMLPSQKQLDEAFIKYHLKIAHYFEPSSILGGDFWQIFPLSKTKLGFYICDFSGHGVASALNTFRLHALVSQNNARLKTPALFLKHLNKQMHLLLPRGQFATMFLGIFDIRKKILTYAGAGAPNPILLRGTKQYLLQSEGLPLGILPNPEYKDFVLKLKSKDSLLLYSDALTESPNKKGERLGLGSFQKMVASSIKKTNLNKDLDVLLQNFFNFAPPPPPDDVTAVLLQWEGK